jgi:hypothetical protein
MTTESLDLICYKYDGWQPRIRAASQKRQWMEETGERYAYRCLPLSIANAHGWELLSPCAFEAKWDGGHEMSSVRIEMDEGYAEHLKPISLFGYGTMTFHIEAIFRTPPGWNLWVSGSPNLQKDGIQPLGGIIETDWSPYTFTMNWRFTRADHWVRFEENEPIAFVFPVERGRVERFRPRIERLEEQEELKTQFEKWSKSRIAFQKWVQEVNPPKPADKWQKLYYRGLDADGNPGPADHQSKVRVMPFRRPDGSLMEPGEARSCPMRHQTPPPPAPAALQASPQNALLMPGLGGGMGANPGLSVALSRIGFGGGQPVRQEAPAPVEDKKCALALKRREWILDVQTRQRRLSPRNREVERVRGLSGPDFLDLYYALSRPVVIEGAMDGWPALGWTPERLAEKVGSAPVEYQGGREADERYEIDKDAFKRVIPFDRFIAEIQASGYGNDKYITAYNSAANRQALAPLAADLGFFPDYLTYEHGMMWIGPMGTFTPLHFDLTNNFIAQIVGSKQVILAPPSEAPKLYNDRHVFSAVRDINDEEQLAQYPLAREAETLEVTLAAGEALFIPLGWWHQVTALDFSVTMTCTNFIWPNEGHEAFPTD